MELYREPLISAAQNAPASGTLRSGSLFAARAVSGADVSQLCRALVSSSPDCIEILDPTGRWEFINERGLALMEIDDFKSYAARRWPESFPPESRELAEEALTAASEGRIARFQSMCPTLKGNPKWWDTLVTPVFDAKGQIQRLVCTSRDITAIKAAEEQLQGAMRELEAASRAKDEFLANLSHELRTPLTSILGFAELLSQEDIGTESRSKALRIEKAGQSLLALVNDMLDLARAGAGTLRMQAAPCDLGAVVDHVAELAQPLADQKGLDLHVELSSELDGVFELDGDRVRQVLLNLVNNAIKFTDRGQVKVSAEALMAEGAAWLQFRVSDTGHGIPATSLPTLFERFTQVDSSFRRSHGGAGLGLAICKELTQRMGGRIGVESTFGEGSTFWIRLPMIPATEGAQQHAPASQATPAQLRILLADDSEANRQLLSLMLNSAGHDVVLAEDGVEALAHLANEDFDLVLMDIQMPRMDGVTAIRALRKSNGRNALRPVLAITANVFPEQVASYIAAGANDYVSKPFNTAELLAKVARWGHAQGELTDEVEALSAAALG